MKTTRLYVDFHVLQTVPPSCVNRDDTGSPKTAVYGGTTRARVSSQAWKRAMRLMFKEELLSDEELGLRTKKIVAMVAEEIISIAPERAQDAEKLATKALSEAGLKIKNADKGTDALFFMSGAQARALAELAANDCADKKAYKKALNSNPSVDMLLFGRMVADDPSLNYDAAAQVAHSISTHAVHNEYDYFTAVDDRAPEDNAGAGHLGTVEYNSATMYRYATVNVMELNKHIGKAELMRVIRAFGEAFVRSMPTGKQNTFANRTLPDAVYVTVRTDQPVNLCGAFERAIPAGEQGFVVPSKKRLCTYAKELYRDYAGEPARAFAVGAGLEDLAEPMPLCELLDAMPQAVAELLPAGEVL